MFEKGERVNEKGVERAEGFFLGTNARLSGVEDDANTGRTDESRRSTVDIAVQLRKDFCVGGWRKRMMCGRAGAFFRGNGGDGGFCGEGKVGGERTGWTPQCLCKILMRLPLPNAARANQPYHHYRWRRFAS